MDRNEHLDWAKQRALVYVSRDDLTGAIASLLSDLGKHEDTADHGGIELTGMLLLAGKLNTATAVRQHIEGFN